MNTTYQLSSLSWNLSGWLPYIWKLGGSIESAVNQSAEVAPIPACVPGSVQKALLDAGLISDWNVGMNYRACQWVENLHWIYQTTVPDSWLQSGAEYELSCEGLDGSGWIFINGQQAAAFNGSHLPVILDLTSYIRPNNNTVQIVFDCPPRWLGQFGYTSQMTDPKVRFYYTWDWTARLVQIGIWDAISLKVTQQKTKIESFHPTATVDIGMRSGTINVRGAVQADPHSKIEVAVEHDGKPISVCQSTAQELNQNGVKIHVPDIKLWWPNLHGEQPVYTAKLTLYNADNAISDVSVKTIGFREITWCHNPLSDETADCWVVSCNGKRIFIQGANWVPIRPNFADVTENQYRELLSTYAQLGFNLLRVWGGAMLEKECFYDICDELGIMIWQEFPLSSSGIDNYPPTDENFISYMRQVAQSYVLRRKNHPALIIWCGGNELFELTDNSKPVYTNHPLIEALSEICRQYDPDRRFVAASPSGPTCSAFIENYGKGLHWDVHGPWKPGGFGMKDESLAEWGRYWEQDDALFHSEFGCPGASSLDILEAFKGDCEVMPPTTENPFWHRPICWWIDYDNVVSDNGRSPSSAAEYIAWSQKRQAQALETAVSCCKSRFPECGGVIIWMGHDCYPCASNTSVIDYYGRPKPAALAISAIFHQQ